MKYLFLAYRDEKRWEAMPTSERAAFEEACLANDETLRKNGTLVALEGLPNRNSATTVQVRNGKVSVTDSPFIQTKEQLTGIFLIDARDLNNAIYVASKMPQAQEGSIEVRPLTEIDR
jgi:hypothetical protein